MSDLIFTVKQHEARPTTVIFSATTPKGEEFLQLYLVNDYLTLDEMTMLEYLYMAKDMGLSVEVIR